MEPLTPIRRHTGREDLEVAGATMSTWHPDRWLTGWAWDAITAACLLRRDGPPRRVLLLGLGGGTVVRQLVRVRQHEIAERIKTPRRR